MIDPWASKSHLRGLLEKLKEDREILQQQIKNFVDQDVKIQITLKSQN